MPRSQFDVCQSRCRFMSSEMTYDDIGALFRTITRLQLFTDGCGIRKSLEYVSIVH